MEDAFKELMAKAQNENLNPMELNDSEMLDAVDEANLKALKLLDQLEFPSGQENVSDIILHLEAIKTSLDKYAGQLITSEKDKTPMYDRIIKLGAKIDLAIKRNSVQ